MGILQRDKSNGTALVPAAFSPSEAAVDPVDLSPVAVAQEVARVRDLLRATLREGVDYGRISGTRGSPVLLKSGAEVLLAAFGYGHRLEEIRIDVDRTTGEKFGATYRAVITKVMGGTQFDIASCDGYAGRDEPKWRNAPWNTIIRMAEMGLTRFAGRVGCADYAAARTAWWWMTAS